MSFAAVTWAFAQDVDKASTKFVLVALGQCVNAETQDMVCWPSARHLSRMTGQDIKTVESCLKRLRESGHIQATDERKGETGQVIVYRLTTPKSGGITPSDNTPENGGLETSNTPEFGGVPDGSNTPKFPVKHPQISHKDPQISRQTPPKTGDGIGKGIGKKREEKREERANALHVPGVPAQVLADYLKVRNAKKAGPLTETVLAGLNREAEKAGITLAQAITVCCERGWQGFKAEWYRPASGPVAPAAPQESAYERRMREQYQRLGLSVAAAAPGQEQAADFFDMEVTDVTPRRLG